MATIVHRRYTSRAAATVSADPRAPDPRLNNLTWVGWASVVFAVATLIVELLPLSTVGALSDANRISAIVLVLRSVAASAAIALPAALELGLKDARGRVPWLYRGAVLLALAQVLLFALGEVSDRVVTDVDRADPSSPVLLAFSVGSLAAAILQVAGAWSVADGLADLGARPRRAFVLGLPVIAAAATLGGYLGIVIPYLEAAIGAGNVQVTIVPLLRLAVGILLSAVIVALGVRLVDGGSRGLRPRRAWLTGWIAGAGLIGSVFATALLIEPLQSVFLPLAILSLLLEMLGWVLLVSALAAGLGRGAVVDVEPRRYQTRWVRYPAA
jgi:hypothetical protein